MRHWAWGAGRREEGAGMDWEDAVDDWYDESIIWFYARQGKNFFSKRAHKGRRPVVKHGQAV